MRTEPSEMTSNIRKRPRSTMPVISTENTSGFCPSGTNTHRGSRKSGGCPKRPLVLLWIQIQVVPTIAKPENLQSSQCLWHNIMDYVQLPEGENTPPKRLKSSKKEEKKPPAGKVQRIRLYPTQNERLKLRKWMGTVRWTYNQCLIAIEKEGVKWNKKDLRARCINAENFKNNTKLKWVIETPYPIRDEAMRDLLKGYSSNFASNKKFKMKFRSKKDPRQSIVIHSQHWGRSHDEYSFLPKIKSAEPLPEKLGYDSCIVMNRLEEFYLCIPKALEIRTENQGPLKGLGVITLDPGVRTFMTGYDPSGIAIEWGKK
ncbi:hypothetical protein Glove_332g19 [Diversispora epigaea]|uniref:Transposase putative helix-turn-helix domain-containing protein n=1 Tax=Diversispora epigaea TaxID=1348612 RepID=A0A397HNH0_9GLOM|nr:hypothetical protein Glove_332g19 [Diversispora epigaea]